MTSVDAKKRLESDRELLSYINTKSLQAGMPAQVTAAPAADARAMLRRFNYNHPFWPVGTVPQAPRTVKFSGTTAVDINLPDGCIFVEFNLSTAGDIIIAFQGTAPDPATLTNDVVNGPDIGGTINSNLLLNPTPDRGFFCYGTRQISARGAANAILNVICYVADDVAFS